MKVLTVNVEISDQCGTSENIVVGVFDDEEKLQLAKEMAEEKYRDSRTYFKIIEIGLNEFYCKRSYENNYISDQELNLRVLILRELKK